MGTVWSSIGWVLLSTRSPPGLVCVMEFLGVIISQVIKKGSDKRRITEHDQSLINKFLLFLDGFDPISPPASTVTFLSSQNVS